MTAEWVDVAKVADFADGTVRVVALEDGREVAVFNVGGRFYAIEDRCSHEEEALSWGVTEGDEVICPRHGARFSLVTGAALTPPACEPVATFAVRVEGGIVQVGAAPAR
ncbi:non-heme iron oxygenase ferredoxin subunit [Aromatoleum toluclasticum]|nr:non-heme iron oxygenase ferredoxin subunit [Aromatoleum toluclasticum]